MASVGTLEAERFLAFGCLKEKAYAILVGILRTERKKTNIFEHGHRV